MNLKDLDGQIIEIVNWDKYQSRKDIKSPTWFRLQNSLFESPNFIDFNHAETLSWIYLLCQASKKQSSQVELCASHIERIGRVSLKDFASAVEKLVKLQCVCLKSESRNVHVTSTSRPRTLQTDSTDKTEKILVSTEASKNESFGAIPNFSGDDEIEGLLKGLRRSTQMRWIKLYTDELWIRTELLKAIAWLESNPQRAPKTNLARFLGLWLSRGWESYRKTLGKSSGGMRILQPKRLEDIA